MDVEESIGKKSRSRSRSPRQDRLTNTDRDREYTDQRYNSYRRRDDQWRGVGRGRGSGDWRRNRDPRNDKNRNMDTLVEDYPYRRNQNRTHDRDRYGDSYRVDDRKGLEERRNMRHNEKNGNDHMREDSTPVLSSKPKLKTKKNRGFKWKDEEPAFTSLSHDRNNNKNIKKNIEDSGGGGLVFTGVTRPSKKEKITVGSTKVPSKISSSGGEEMIIVNVNDRLGTKAQIPCFPSDPIKAFKHLVALQIGRKPHEILLKRQGERPFKDELTLEDYGVSNGVQIDLELDAGGD